MTPLEQAIAEQRACRAYLDGPEREPNWHQMTAWIMEEAILRLDQEYVCEQVGEAHWCTVERELRRDGRNHKRA